jgi:hypothetical protein
MPKITAKDLRGKNPVIVLCERCGEEIEVLPEDLHTGKILLCDNCGEEKEILEDSSWSSPRAQTPRKATRYKSTGKGVKYYTDQNGDPITAPSDGLLFVIDKDGKPHKLNLAYIVGKISYQVGYNHTRISYNWHWLRWVLLALVIIMPIVLLDLHIYAIPMPPKFYNDGSFSLWYISGRIPLYWIIRYIH